MHRDIRPFFATWAGIAGLNRLLTTVSSAAVQLHQTILSLRLLDLFAIELTVCGRCRRRQFLFSRIQQPPFD
jgi:hypothetical protein